MNNPDLAYDNVCETIHNDVWWDVRKEVYLDSYWILNWNLRNDIICAIGSDARSYHVLKKGRVPINPLYVGRVFLSSRL